MDSLLVPIGALLVIGLGVVIWLLLQQKDKKDDGRAMLLLQQQLQDLRNSLDRRMEETSRSMHESVKTQFSHSQSVIRDINDQMVRHLTDVTKGVTEANEASKQIFTVAESLKDLERVFTHQKQRGNWGEASLEMILSNILPPTAYVMQHRFQDGEVVDACIHTKEGMVPVDAKFSLDNYMRLGREEEPIRKAEIAKEFETDLKKRIDETSKYIRPKEGTLPFAFMYIPAEAIYYDLLTNEVGGLNARSLIDYAYKDKKVIIVSPTTFAAYLQSVLYGFRALKIEESAKDIIKYVENLTRHLQAYDQFVQKMGTSLGTTVSHFNAAQKEFKKIDKDVYKIAGTSLESDIMALEKPEREEV